MQNAELLKPLMSVVTLTYNNFEHFLESVQSVLEQDYERIEFLICDDASESFPLEDLDRLLGQYGSPAHVRIVRNKTNMGTVRNLNRAFKMAEGDYITCLSSGDVFFSKSTVREIVCRMIETQARVLVPSRLLYRGDFEPVCLLPHLEEREIIGRLDTPLKQYKAHVTEQSYNMVSGCVMCYSREAVEKHRYFDERYDLWEDGPFLEKFLWGDTLTFAHDIVSIWYEDGGVSRPGSKRGRNPRLEKDLILYSQSDKLKHLDSLTRRERCLVEFYNAKLVERDTFAARVFTRIAHLRAFLDYRWYAVKRRMRVKRDLEYIRVELLDDSREGLFPLK